MASELICIPPRTIVHFRVTALQLCACVLGVILGLSRGWQGGEGSYDDASRGGCH